MSKPESGSISSRSSPGFPSRSNGSSGSGQLEFSTEPGAAEPDDAINSDGFEIAVEAAPPLPPEEEI